MLTQHIALVPEAGGVDLAELARVSAALQKQVIRDVAPQWAVSATVDAFHTLEDVPVGYWPIILSSGDLAREGGLHLDRNGQPYAQIGISPFWSLEASRACLELLVNPFGDRTTSGSSPRPDQGQVDFLVEVCGPCAARMHGYAINGVFVADFCTPAFFGVNGSTRVASESFNGSLSTPFQVLQGGYLTWLDSTTNRWWVRIMPGHAPLDIELGSVSHPHVSARALAQGHGPDRGWAGSTSSRAFTSSLQRLRDQSLEASQLRALRLRSLLGERLQESLLAPPFRTFERAVLELPDHAPLWDTRSILVSGGEAAHAHEPAHEPAPARPTPAQSPASHTLRGPAVVPEYALCAPTPAAEAVMLPPPPPLPQRASDAPRSASRVPSSIAPASVRTSMAPHPVERDHTWIGLTALAAAAVFAMIWSQSTNPGSLSSHASSAGSPMIESAPTTAAPIANSPATVAASALPPTPRLSAQPAITATPATVVQKRAVAPYHNATRQRSTEAVRAPTSTSAQPLDSTAPAALVPPPPREPAAPNDTLDQLIESRR